MNKIQIGKQEIIHFIGIGGIGMSGLAQVMKTMGFNVQGSDLTRWRLNQQHHTNRYLRIGISASSLIPKRSQPRQ